VDFSPCHAAAPYLLQCRQNLVGVPVARAATEYPVCGLLAVPPQGQRRREVRFPNLRSTV